MSYTEVMQEREKCLGATWHDEGNGYFSMVASAFFGAQVAYVALPTGHPDCGKQYDDLSPDVNGGLTYGEDNVYGWDYGHAYNRGSPETDIPRALAYFRSRSAVVAAKVI